MTAIPLGVGIYEPTDAQVTAARAWFAAHPATRDRVVVEARLRWVIRGLQRHHLPVLMEEVLEGTGATWADPETWPARWPAEWAAEGEVIARPAPEPDPAPELPPMPRPVRVRTQRAPGGPRPLAEVQRPAPPPPAAEVPLDVALRQTRPTRAKAAAATPRRTKAPKAVPGWVPVPAPVGTVGVPVHGVPGAEGVPVRASRVPMHLRPPEWRRVWAFDYHVLGVMDCARREGRSLTHAELGEAVGRTEPTIHQSLVRLRKADFVRTLRNTGRARVWSKGRAYDLSTAVTPSGQAVAACLPPVLAPMEGRLGATREDEVDMVLIEELRRRHAAGAGWVRGLDLVEGVPGLSRSDRDSAPRLQAAGVIERARRGGELAVWLRLAPAVQVAWGCVAGGAP